MAKTAVNLFFVMRNKNLGKLHTIGSIRTCNFPILKFLEFSHMLWQLGRVSVYKFVRPVIFQNSYFAQEHFLDEVDAIFWFLGFSFYTIFISTHTFFLDINNYHTNKITWIIKNNNARRNTVVEIFFIS